MKFIEMIKNKKDIYTIEIIPTYNPLKYYVIKTYFKGNVKTVNQLINGVIFYNKWIQHNKANIAYIKES